VNWVIVVDLLSTSLLQWVAMKFFKGQVLVVSEFQGSFPKKNKNERD